MAKRLKGNRRGKLLTLLARSQAKRPARTCVPSSLPSDPSPAACYRGPRQLMPFHHYARLGLYSPVPVSVYSRVLLVGEGNFSYAYSLLSYLGRERLDADGRVFYFLATCYEAEPELYAKYPESRQFVAGILGLGGHVLFKVDATALGKDKRLAQGKPFTRVIFNFPHTGKGIKDQDRNIAYHRKFLKEFLHSAASLLLSSSTGSVARRGRPSVLKPRHLTYRTVYLRPCDSDSLRPKTDAFCRARKPSHDSVALSSDGEPSSCSDGTDSGSDSVAEDVGLSQAARLEERAEIHVTLKTGHPYSEWDVKRVARSVELPAPVSLACRESFAFERSRYPSYTHVNTIGHLKSKREREQEATAPGPVLAVPSVQDSGASLSESPGPDMDASLHAGAVNAFAKWPHPSIDHLQGKPCKTFVFVLSEQAVAEKEETVAHRKIKSHTS